VLLATEDQLPRVKEELAEQKKVNARLISENIKGLSVYRN